MRIRLDNVLLCILWILAVTLGACFWFNTVFGFNIFSGEHWEYVASLQATKAPIKTTFYVSMAITIFVAILGLYMVVRPSMRKIRLPIIKKSNHTNDIKTQKAQDASTTQSVKPDTDASTLDIISEGAQQGIAIPPRPQGPSASARPPRLVLPKINNTGAFQQPSSQLSPIAQPRNTGPTDEDIKKLEEIFTNAGYAVKKNARVNGTMTALIAIGSNETMWLGYVGVPTTKVREIVEKFEQIFSDTLDETEININGFTISAPDESTSEFEDILMFKTIEDLQAYMQDKQNPLPEDDEDREMFDAYSQYIDAVITHIGLI